MSKKIVVEELVRRMNEAQIERFNNSNKSLSEFLDSKDEDLVTEAIQVLARIKDQIPIVVFDW